MNFLPQIQSQGWPPNGKCWYFHIFYSRILYLTYYFQTYEVCIITTIQIKSKIQHKIHYKIQIYIKLLLKCNDLKIKSDHIILENKRHETKLHYNIRVLLHQNWSLTLTWVSLSLFPKTTQCSHHDHNLNVHPSSKLL